MGLWGTTTADDDKPKFLPVDSNAGGSTGAREHLIASASGWALAPGLAASGNDNTSAQPEILVCVKNIAEAMGNASIIGIDWTDATVGDTGTFDISFRLLFLDSTRSHDNLAKSIVDPPPIATI